MLRRVAPSTSDELARRRARRRRRRPRRRAPGGRRRRAAGRSASGGDGGCRRATSAGDVRRPGPSSRAATACSTSGAGASRRPSASTASARSSRVAPAPPAASGTAMPGAPTATSCSHSSGAKPTGSWSRSRSSGTVRSASAPNTSTIDCCSSRRVEVHEVRILHTPMLDPTCLAPHAVARGRPPPPTRSRSSTSTARALTYAELDRRARAWAGALAARGVARGRPRRHDAARTRSTPTSRCSRWRGCASVEVPLNVAFTGRMLAYSLDHADVTTLVVAPEFRRRGRRRSRPTSRSWRGSSSSTTPPAPRSTPAPTATALELVGPQYRDVHSLMFTSGTTGPSKAVITPWAVMYQFWSWVPDDALGVGRRPVLRDAAVPQLRALGVQLRDGRAARRFVIRDRFSATDFWDDVRRHRLRHRGPGRVR